MKRIGQRFFFLTFCTFLLACSEDRQSTPVDAGSSDVGDIGTSDSITADVAPDAAILDGTWSFVISDWMSTQPLGDVTLCASIEGTDCQRTDTDGIASISGVVTPGELVQLRGDREGYFPFLVESLAPQELPTNDEPIPYVMADNDIVGQLVSSLGAEVDDTAGHISMFVTTSDAVGEFFPLLGATVTIDSSVEAGPNYLNAADDFGSGLFATEPGVTRGGVVQFFNVEPGVATITIDGDYSCVTGTSGTQQDDESVSITVEAGRVSYTSLNCIPNSRNSAEGTTRFLISDWATGGGIADATLCLSLEGVDCQQTDADGLASFTATMTSGDIVALRGDASGYTPFYAETLVPGEIVFTDDPYGWLMISSDFFGQLTAALDVTQDDTKGHLSVNAYTWDGSESVPLAGPVVNLTEGTAAAGPGYLNAPEDMASSIFAAEAGLTSQGLAAFVNVDPGRVAVTVEGYACSPLMSGVNNDAGAMTINIDADRLSYMVIICEAD